MDITKLDIYQRLRDFNVPSSLLDAIFDNEDDLKVLINTWTELKDQGLSGDEIAREVAELIFKELDTSLDLD